MGIDVIPVDRLSWSADITLEHPPNWMIQTARQGATKRVLENRDLRALGAQSDQ